MINPMELSPQQITALYRTSMDEVASIAHPDPKYNLFQLKYDGWWVAVKILDTTLQIITSGAEIRKTYVINNPKHVSALLLGEWMYGTNWAGTHNPGCIFIHDLVCWNEDYPPSFTLYDGQKDEYRYRLEMLESVKPRLLPFRPILNVVPTYTIDQLQEVWINSPDFEGVVLKSGRTGLGREMEACKIKRTFTEDYVVMGISEGQGRLAGKMGALQGGQYVKGNLTSICSVGGGFTDAVRREIWENQAAYLGKVFEAQGKARFNGGALRHPNFLRWREDKPAELCIRREA